MTSIVNFEQVNADWDWIRKKYGRFNKSYELEMRNNSYHYYFGGSGGCGELGWHFYFWGGMNF